MLIIDRYSCYCGELGISVDIDSVFTAHICIDSHMEFVLFFQNSNEVFFKVDSPPKINYGVKVIHLEC